MSTKIEVERQPYDEQPEWRVRVTEFGEVVKEIARFWRKDDAIHYTRFLRGEYPGEPPSNTPELIKLRKDLADATASLTCLAKERDAWKSCWSAWKRKAEEAEAKLVPNPDYVNAPRLAGGIRFTPHRCPVCLGKGMFFEVGSTPFSCKACAGTGILWKGQSVTFSQPLTPMDSLDDPTEEKPSGCPTCGHNRNEERDPVLRKGDA